LWRDSSTKASDSNGVPRMFTPSFSGKVSSEGCRRPSGRSRRHRVDGSELRGFFLEIGKPCFASKGRNVYIVFRCLSLEARLRHSQLR
jgi:hypothetical protein